MDKINVGLKNYNVVIYNLLIISLFFVISSCLNRKEYNGIGSAGEPSWGANNQIAFIYTPYSIINDDTIAVEDSSGLWIIEPDGSKMRLLIVGNYDEPKWSIDCKWMVCSDQNGQLWKVNIKNKTVLQIPLAIRAWSPNYISDKQKVIFATPDSSQFGRRGIYRITLNENNPQFIFPYGINPSINSRGDKIVFSGWLFKNGEWSGGIIEIDSTGNNPRFIYEVGSNYPPNNAVFSPDDSLIAFDTGTSDPEIWMIKVDGTNLKKIIDHGRMPSFSPTGQKIVYQRYAGIPRSVKLWIMDNDGSNNYQLTF